MHNEARRFIMFVDQLYERQTRLMCTAHSEPMSLFTEMKHSTSEGTSKSEGVRSNIDKVEGTSATETATEDEEEEDPFGRDLVANMVRVEELASVKELSFAYQRAASRLIEMQSIEYDEKHTKDTIQC